MGARTSPPEKDRNVDVGIEEGLPTDQSDQRVLKAREYYDEKHPWFGSQIHYTIDVFRQLIRDSRAKSHNSPKHGS